MQTVNNLCRARAAAQVHSSERVVVGERMASRQAQLASSVTV